MRARIAEYWHWLFQWAGFPLSGPVPHGSALHRALCYGWAL